MCTALRRCAKRTCHGSHGRAAVSDDAVHDLSRISRPPNRLTIGEAPPRFDVPRPTLLDWCKQDRELAVRQPGSQRPNKFRWLIDAPRLAVLMAGRISIEKAATRFGVPSATLSGHDPARLGMLLAVLPIEPKPDKRKRQPAVPRPGLGHDRSVRVPPVTSRYHRAIAPEPRQVAAEV